MITAEMIEQADSKHHMQFYETGKNGTTFEFGAPITPMDFAIDTPIEKSSWTPTRLADYIESQRKNPEMAFEVKGCENILRGICGESEKFLDAYGRYDEEYLRTHTFSSRDELKTYISSYQPEAIANICRNYDIPFHHPDTYEGKMQMFDTIIDKLSDKLSVQKEITETYEEKLDGPEELTAESFDERAPLHSLIDYSHWYDISSFEKMQETLQKELADDETHDRLKNEALENTLVTSKAIEGIGGPYLTTNSSRPLTLDPYLAYNPETDSFNIQFSIFDTEVLDKEGNHFGAEQTDNLYDNEDLQDFGLSIPAEKVVSMNYEQFQTTFENGMTKFFEHCLKDETFQKRHPIIQQVVEKQLECFKNHVALQQLSQSPTLQEVGPVLRCLHKYAEDNALFDDDDAHMIFIEDDENSIQDFIHDIHDPGIQSIQDIRQDIENDLQKFPKLKDVIGVGEDEAIVTCYGDFLKYFAEPKQEKVSDNLNLHDLLESDKRKAAVQEMTKFFLKNGMDVNQIDDVLSDVKMTALFQAVELEKKDPSLGASKDSGR